MHVSLLLSSGAPPDAKNKKGDTPLAKAMAKAAAAEAPSPGRRLAFTRYCHYQYGTVYGIHKEDRVRVVYCALVVQ